MALIRPEAAKALSRWSEAMTGAAISALGLYWAFFTGGGLLHWIGYFLAVLGAFLCASGIRRARFAHDEDGLGLVQITERQISYFSPTGGGALSVDGLWRVTVDVLDLMVVQWVFVGEEGTLAIPIDAAGTDAIFDMLSALPGADFEAAIRAMSATEPHSYVIWRKPSVQTSVNRVH
ncbi:hypothetical protein J7443_14150 [Tropicibacter sp. R15_0]|uniref:hypothetical protein n=1 Tax=Tropicibacter sp. R15_0 TaxID=2821101 RepID=UPI001ADBDC38|nr:hypothetical protein [Tropicibacter sp. R15_0]MBO9466383.1 hypothetical protein [Tropicibacter sp. R15_0]